MLWYIILLVCCREVNDFLGERPFEDYQQTMYFARYLQWKWLERYMFAFVLQALISKSDDGVLMI